MSDFPPHKYGITPSELHQSSSSMYYAEGIEDSFTTSFTGDFYREPDNIVRGVSIAAADTSAFDVKTFPYEDEPQITRGVTMGMSSHDPLLSGEYDFSYFDEFKLGKGSQNAYISQPTWETDVSSESKILAGDLSFLGVPEEHAFKQEHNEPGPLSVPDNPFFHLPVTTINIVLAANQQVIDIGNTILLFLNKEVQSSISKVRQSKFWIKADVFIKNPQVVRYSMCTLKVRVYKTLDGQYAVEFARRGGDAIVFSTAFQMAVAFFKDYMTVVGEAGDMTPPPPIPGFGVLPSLFGGADPNDDPTKPEFLLGPILDMATMTTQPALQAESAASLANIAEEEADLEGLCIAPVFDVIKQHLIFATTTEVGFPLAKLLQRLVHCQKAAPLFTDLKFLRDTLAEAQTRAKANDALVSGLLAKVLSIALVENRWVDQLKVAEAMNIDAMQEFLVQARDALQESPSTAGAKRLYSGSM